MAATKTIPFFGTALANASAVLVSKRIPSAFTLRRIRVHFAPGSNNLLTLRIFTSEDPTAPASGPPTGLSVLQNLGQVDYLAGEDDTMELNHDQRIPLAGTWLKIYAVNSDFFDHSVNAQLTIDLDD